MVTLRIECIFLTGGLKSKGWDLKQSLSLISCDKYHQASFFSQYAYYKNQVLFIFKSIVLTQFCNDKERTQYQILTIKTLNKKHNHIKNVQFDAVIYYRCTPNKWRCYTDTSAFFP